MDEQDLLNQLRNLARRTARGAFEREKPGFFLLGTVPRTVSDFEIRFVTDVRHIDEIKAEHDRMRRAQPKSMQPGPFVVAIQKKDTNRWMRWVSVGRALNNDVVLRHSSVSKLHARLQADTADPDGDTVPTAGDEQHPYFLTDVGSARGTTVNGKVLSTSQPQRLEVGDTVKFGEIQCHFLDSGMLYDRLRRMPHRPPTDSSEMASV